MPNYALNILTKGFLESSGTSISTNGFILEDLWKDVEPIIPVIINGGGGVTAYEKLSDKDKNKIIKLVLFYKNKRYEEKHEYKYDKIKVDINSTDVVTPTYEVTHSDIKTIIKEYNKRKGKYKITVDDVKIK